MAAPKTKTVEMLIGVTGTRDGAEWPPRGGHLTCSVDEADQLIAAGFARIPEDVPVNTAPETAVARKGETRKGGLTKASMN